MGKKRKIQVRKNIAFLIPAIPYIAVGLAGVVGLSYASSATAGAADNFAKVTGPLVGGAGGYLIARSRKLDMAYQIAGAGLGVGLGFIAQKTYERMAAKAVEQQQISEAQKWCNDSPVMSWFAPSCY